MANFIPPCEGGESGYLFSASHKLAVFEEKNRLTKIALAAKVANFFFKWFLVLVEERSNYQIFETCLFAIDVLKKFQAILFMPVLR